MHSTGIVMNRVPLCAPNISMSIGPTLFFQLSSGTFSVLQPGLNFSTFTWVYQCSRERSPSLVWAYYRIPCSPIGGLSLVSLSQLFVKFTRIFLKLGREHLYLAIALVLLAGGCPVPESRYYHVVGEHCSIPRRNVVEICSPAMSHEGFMFEVILPPESQLVEI